MLDAREALFLRRRYDLSIYDEAGGRVVIERGYAEDAGHLGSLRIKRR
jgi:hypothetical protein